ncbi:serine O-acetyltransferase [Galbitalea sp. SE-J8]|uniref:serine O-acetyltransferase EpsC n=1 Tax=Galbitalea sp. SE-J8 TaxID=3054952 RepID=UPI00259D11E2|nr:serine O-acetyltransferase EpsC [Galbitalea sp. SE-J8]MDM4762196.1 serine O-acetyltransferase [Galbitalea sp. SE-J8]
MGLFNVREDVAAARRRDPAARSAFEVWLLYSGLHAVWWHRLAHALWGRRMRLLARVLAQMARILTGVEIHPGARIGRRLFIDHGMGVVIGETAEIGDDVTMYHGVTLGGTALDAVKRHPTIGDRVLIGAAATLLGPISIGADSAVGAGAVVLRSAPPRSIVTGVPAVARPRDSADHEPVWII